MIQRKIKSFKPYTKGTPKNVLEVGDQHEPFSLNDYIEFVYETQIKYKCGKVIFMGDLTDQHAMNYHEHNPNGYSPKHEMLLAKQRLSSWYKTFPIAKVCYGNHDLIVARKAITNGIPDLFMRNFPDVISAPKTWEFAMTHIINGVFHSHGTGVSGVGGCFKIMQQNRMSSIIAHLHSESNIRFSASFKDLLFAKTVGCGLNYKLYPFDYGKNFVAKPVINVGVTLENGRIPLLIPMKL